jgi:heat shock protein HtpX
VKRVFLFIVVNILVLVTISIVLSILNIGPYLSEQGIDYTSLLIFCAVVGFSGALISLALSRWMAKMMLGVQVIDPSQPQTGAERDLVRMVQSLTQKAGLPMPEVGVYASNEVNAFATGPTKAKALVAVSSGLLQQMDNRAVEGVIGHEISHIASGDMVTMTLLQGVINTFVMFFARIAAWIVAQAFAGDRENERSGPSPIVHFIAVIIFEILFSMLGAIVVAFFSRKREFRADSGSARLTNRDTMIHALQSLKQSVELVDTRQQSVMSLKISGRPRRFFGLFATHPDLDVRIEALRQLK